VTRVAYLISRYPAVSHAFVQREVLALRDAAVEVDTFSLRRADHADVLSPVDEAERDATYAIQPVRWGRLAATHLRALVSRPGAYVRTLAYAFGLGSGARGRLWQLFYFAEAVIVWAEMHKRGLRHVHVHFANAGADVAMLTAAFGGGDWRWSLTLHGPAEFFEVKGNRLAEKLESAAFVACASDWARSQAMSIAPADAWPRFAVVRGGVDAELWRRMDGGGSGASSDAGGSGTTTVVGGSGATTVVGGSGAKRDPDGSGERVEILNVGRLAPVKGQGLLIDAIGRLRDEGIDVHCRIVGDGPEQAALERRIGELGLHDSVELTGAVGQDRIRERYEQADIFCLPSFREGLPFVLIEALSMELAVVATRIMGVPELVNEGESGVLVTPGRVDQLADALADLARAPERRRHLGAAGRAVVQRDYTLSRLATEMAALFATGRPPARP
jgi:colanic acid/amylovoran biosynthesis glycosyltransferase